MGFDVTPTNDSSKAANEISSQFSVNMKMLVSEAKSFTSSRGAYSITANPNSLQIPLAKEIDSRLHFKALIIKISQIAFVILVYHL